MFKKKDVLFTNVLHNRLLMYSIDQSLNLVFFYPSDRNLKIFFYLCKCTLLLLLLNSRNDTIVCICRRKNTRR